MAEKTATERRRCKEVAVKKHPIVMSAWSMRRILAGAKTQTRRVMKPQPMFADRSGGLGRSAWRWSNRKGSPGFYWNEGESPNSSIAEYSPFGVPGDLLWVREPLVKLGGITLYEADREQVWDVYPGMKAAHAWTWKRDHLPAIFCPRWASRLTLRVKRVWAERLMDITREDAIAEGVEPYDDGGYSPDDECYEVWRYLAVWDELNAKRGWDAEKNPWVWATEFEEVK